MFCNSKKGFRRTGDKSNTEAGDGAGGDGISVLQHDEFMEFLHSSRVENVMSGDDIMQVYFQSPYLLHGHKSEVALY